MNLFKTLALGAVAFGALAIGTPAQAHDHHHHGDRHWDHWDHHRSRVVFYGGPRYYSRPYYDDYYYAPSYSYYRPYPAYGYYGYGGPSFTFAFGGSRGHWHHHH